MFAVTGRTISVPVSVSVTVTVTVAPAFVPVRSAIAPQDQGPTRRRQPRNTSRTATSAESAENDAIVPNTTETVP